MDSKTRAERRREFDATRAETWPDKYSKRFRPEVDIRFRALDVSEQIIEAERAIVVTVATESVARDRGILRVRGIDTKAYRQNPAMLWSHDAWSPWVGRSMWEKAVKDESGGYVLRAKLEFYDTQIGEELWQLYSTKRMRGFSIGFDLSESREPTERELDKNPGWREAGLEWIGERSELLEISAASVPSDRDAVMRAVDGGEVRHPVLLDHFERMITAQQDAAREASEMESDSEIVVVRDGWVVDEGAAFAAFAPEDEFEPGTLQSFRRSDGNMFVVGRRKSGRCDIHGIEFARGAEPVSVVETARRFGIEDEKIHLTPGQREAMLAIDSADNADTETHMDETTETVSLRAEVATMTRDAIAGALGRV
jgi:HK97 family phage prohead protease